MTTTVVNVKVAYIRPEYKNLREWCEDKEKNVYIGRRGPIFIDGERYPKKDSAWCNPYKVSAKNSREEAMVQYRLYIKTRLLMEPELKAELLTLKGKRLGCWCRTGDSTTDACHGDVLVELLEKEDNK